MSRRHGKRKRIGGKRSKSAPAVLIRRSPVKRRKQWTNIQMEKAMEAVMSGVGINRAAMEHGVPRTTLKDRISGRVDHGDNPGPAPYLSKEEEKELGAFLKRSAALGYGKSRKQVMAIAEIYVKHEKRTLKAAQITQGWWRQFLTRQKDLSLRRGDNTSHIRMDAINPETIAQYFKLLKETLEQNKLMNSPQQIYNVDETGVPLDPKGLSVFAVTGSKKVRVRSTGKKGQVTVVACGNASGQVLPPMLIFDAKKLCHGWTREEVPGTSYGLSDKGWITTELFESWLYEHFLKHAVPARPLLLLLDGHSTHYQPQLIRMAREKGVLILCLPPHTTHEAQPLDCGVFSPLKMHWRTICHHFIQSNPGKVINKFNFNSLFSKAWLSAVTPANLISGFKTCGIYPFNSSAIVATVDVCADNDNSVSTSYDQPENDTGDEGTETAGEDITLSTSHYQSENDTGSKSTGTTEDGPPKFTVEQEQLFQKRYDEGYNLTIDPDYVCWLRFHHPESCLPCDSSESYIPTEENLSLSALYSDVTLLEELPIATQGW